MLSALSKLKGSEATPDQRILQVLRLGSIDGPTSLRHAAGRELPKLALCSGAVSAIAEAAEGRPLSAPPPACELNGVPLGMPTCGVEAVDANPAIADDPARLNAWPGKATLGAAAFEEFEPVLLLDAGDERLSVFERLEALKGGAGPLRGSSAKGINKACSVYLPSGAEKAGRAKDTGTPNSLGPAIPADVAMLGGRYLPRWFTERDWQFVVVGLFRSSDNGNKVATLRSHTSQMVVWDRERDTRAWLERRATVS